MPISSRWQTDIPECSLPTQLFGPPGSPLPDSVAFYDADRADTHFLTVSSLRLWCQRFAAGLQKAGLKPGDRVLMFSSSSLFFPIAFLGISMAGGVFTGANPAFTARELAYQLKDSDATFLLCADSSLELGIEAAASIGMGKERVFVFDENLFEGKKESKLGCKNWATLVESEAVGRAFKWYEPRNPKDAICCLNYSSGTTGVPKGVMITHFNYVANVTQYTHLAKLSPDYEAKTRITKLLCFLPMYHALAQVMFIGVAINRRTPVYIMNKFDFVKMLENLQKFRISHLGMVPPIVAAVAKSPITKNYDLSSIIEMASGAAPLSGDIIAQAEALFPDGSVKLRQGWGMTETTCSLLSWDPRKEPLHDSVGELNANCKAKIMALDGVTEVPRGERGEIWVQAPNIMKGYWRNPKATAETIIQTPDGPWMRTGDVAYVNSDGQFFIVDRLKELIKVQGNQVAPAELEALLLEHPQIADAAVVGVTVDGDELPRAYVVLKPGEKVSEQDIQTWVAKRVIKYKRLTGGVKFVESVPKNPSGKILRVELRKLAKLEVGEKPAQAKL